MMGFSVRLASNDKVPEETIIKDDVIHIEQVMWGQVGEAPEVELTYTDGSTELFDTYTGIIEVFQ